MLNVISCRAGERLGQACLLSPNCSQMGDFGKMPFPKRVQRIKPWMVVFIEPLQRPVVSLGDKYWSQRRDTGGCVDSSQLKACLWIHARH